MEQTISLRQEAARPQTPIEMENLFASFIFELCGIFLGIAVFALELIVNKFKK